MNCIHDGNIHFINQRFQLALQSYKNSIDAAQSEPDEDLRSITLFRARSHLAATYLELKNLPDALEETLTAESVLKRVESTNSDRKLNLLEGEVDMFYFRSGKICYELGKYPEAKYFFIKISTQSIESSINYQEWITKCETAMEDIQASKRNATCASSSSSNRTEYTCPKYQYYQNDSFMTIAILDHNIKSENLTVDLSLDKITVILKKGTKSFTIVCGTLYDAIDVTKSKVKYMDDKTLIKLKKKDKCEWHDLFGNGARDKGDDNDGDVIMKNTAILSNNDEKNPIPSKASIDIPEKLENQTINNSKPNHSNQSATSVHSRPYASKKDWNAIERELVKEDDAEKPEGEEALNKLFQDIYSKANEDTRRAMIKSFQTSGGTVLSTNWNEVSSTDYEKVRQAPKGMEWKNWEGDKLPQKDNV